MCFLNPASLTLPSTPSYLLCGMTLTVIVDNPGCCGSSDGWYLASLTSSSSSSSRFGSGLDPPTTMPAPIADISSNCSAKIDLTIS